MQKVNEKRFPSVRYKFFGSLVYLQTSSNITGYSSFVNTAAIFADELLLEQIGLSIVCRYVNGKYSIYIFVTYSSVCQNLRYATAVLNCVQHSSLSKKAFSHCPNTFSSKTTIVQCAVHCGAAKCKLSLSDYYYYYYYYYYTCMD